MLQVKILGPNELLFEGEVAYLLAPVKNNSLGILPGHSPLFAELFKGNIIMYFSDKTERLLAIESGIMKVRADIVTILIEGTSGTVDKDTATTV